MPMHNPCHPGELLAIALIRDEDGNRIDSVQSVANKLNCHRSTLNRVIAGTASITPEMALALESIGAGSAEHWLAMQANYDLFRLRRGRAA
ncbi:HigA family addiction module antitoxin [Microbulbifer sp.]|uniref:HigA family addiction module antitoxin n=1 Tax=Microbulbifer sp. TaxID=1908541 RepID=UPI003F35E350